MPPALGLDASRGPHTTLFTAQHTLGGAVCARNGGACGAYSSAGSGIGSMPNSIGSGRAMTPSTRETTELHQPSSIG